MVDLSNSPNLWSQIIRWTVAVYVGDLRHTKARLVLTLTLTLTLKSNANRNRSR